MNILTMQDLLRERRKPRGFYKYNVKNSVLLNRTNQDFFERTFNTSADSNKVCTLFCAFKMGELSTASRHYLASACVSGSGGSPRDEFNIAANADRGLRASIDNGGGDGEYQSGQLLRDHSQWYYALLSIDTTDATTANRMRFGTNGEWDTYFYAVYTVPQNMTFHWMQNGALMRVAYDTYNGSEGLDGYLASFIAVDGLALNWEDFGEFKNGVWVFTGYNGSYGTNGFHLDFADAADLGKDVSGNGNHFTTSGSPVQSSDTPTNNHAVLNPLNVYPGTVLSDGNRVWTGAVGYNYTASLTTQIASGKWYVESEAVSGGGVQQGFVDAAERQSKWNTSTRHDGYDNAICWQENNVNLTVIDAGTPTSYADLTSTPSLGTPIGLALDLDSNTVQIVGPDGIGPARAIPAGLEWVWMGAANGGTGRVFVSEDEWTYTPPTGFKALCSANLPETDAMPDTVFEPVLYDGTGDYHEVPLDIAQDLTFLKSRTDGNNGYWQWFDRGRSLYSLSSNSTAAEADRLGCFDWLTKGFVLAGNCTRENLSGGSFVAYNIKKQPGFLDIVPCAAGTAEDQLAHANGVAHSLGTTPELVVLKARDVSGDWTVWHKSIPLTKYLLLNGTAAATSWAQTWLVNDTRFGCTASAGSWSGIAYLFASMPGVCKVFSFEGINSADGPFVNCGFRPALVIWKNADATGSWFVYDALRDTYNVMGTYLEMNTVAAENGPHAYLDMVSNGFKLRVASTAGQNYIGIAIAEQPSKYANAR